jgi:hypothetical protein
MPLEPIAEFRHAKVVMDVPVGAETIVFGPGGRSPTELWVAEDAVTIDNDSNDPLTLPPGAKIDGWEMMGSARPLYQAALDPAAKRADTTPLHVHADRAPFPSSVAGAFRAFPAAPLLGKRVRATLWVKTSSLSSALCVARLESGEDEWTGSKLGSKTEHLDGDSDWHACSMDLLVATGAGIILVGVKLEGTGDVWLDAPRVDAIEDAPADAGAADAQ